MNIILFICIFLDYDFFYWWNVGLGYLLYLTAFLSQEDKNNNIVLTHSFINDVFIVSL